MSGSTPSPALRLLIAGPVDQLLFTFGNVVVSLGVAAYASIAQLANFSISMAFVLAVSGVVRGSLAEESALKEIASASVGASRLRLLVKASAMAVLPLIPMMALAVEKQYDPSALWLLGFTPVISVIQVWRGARQTVEGSLLVASIDALWLGVQAFGLLLMVLLAAATPNLVIATWLIGAVVAFVAIVALEFGADRRSAERNPTGSTRRDFAYGVEAAFAFGGAQLLFLLSTPFLNVEEIGLLRTMIVALGPIGVLAAGGRQVAVARFARFPPSIARLRQLTLLSSLAGIVIVIPFVLAATLTGAMEAFGAIGSPPALLAWVFLLLAGARVVGLALTPSISLLRSRVEPSTFVQIRLMHIAASIVGFVFGAAAFGPQGAGAGLLVANSLALYAHLAVASRIRIVA
jgi:hypothetical protein